MLVKPQCSRCGEVLEQLSFADGTPDNLFGCVECDWPDNRYTIVGDRMVRVVDSYESA